MDIVISEEDIKNLVQEDLKKQGYNIESIIIGFDPQLTIPNIGRMPGMAPMGGMNFDHNNPNRNKLAIFAKVNRNESDNQTNS